MVFDRRKFVEIKAKSQNYIAWQTNLDKFKIKEYFYNEERRPLKETFPDKNIECYPCENYRLGTGGFSTGWRYINEQGTYYMFITAKDYRGPVQDIAIGKAVEGTVYLMGEGFPPSFGINCIKITEDYIRPKRKGFVPRSERRTIYIRRGQIEQSIKEITDEDWKCLEIAYEGVKAFNDLIPS